MKADRNPLLFKINMGAGQAAPPAATGRAFRYAFGLDVIGEGEGQP